MQVILNNEENKEVILADYSFVTLKAGYNLVEMTPRRLGIAQKEILERELKIEVITDEKKIEQILNLKEEKKDGVEGNNKTKEK